MIDNNIVDFKLVAEQVGVVRNVIFLGSKVDSSQCKGETRWRLVQLRMEGQTTPNSHW